MEMESEGDGSMSMVMVGQMLNYFHFTTGDVLFFKEWVTSSPGLVAGACIGLIVLGITERCVGVCKTSMDVWWNSRAQELQAKKLEQTYSETPLKASKMALMRAAPPFVPSHDIMRGVFHVVQAGLGFLIMLAVMTFNVGFILSLLLGIGIGEVAFGRYARTVAH
ncbi:hypothetical protein K435DRAFT_779284 [Dendrothele bispora CBS 962.96]|uniref:Copper transport protein n=1 Tax=Dendrothele bispora (strain CBS 962.96) TaxID=1314807 RepID=A0A4S8LYT9_DENBC|nr:hypothetical protein K435DRAFT_780593 [Dendrothele bispora CBS 962.96]THU94876.1 hypothetical protein K435DRAFT_779284 [Dendrothele bispora CBS 962.96]